MIMMETRTVNNEIGSSLTSSYYFLWSILLSYLATYDDEQCSVTCDAIVNRHDVKTATDDPSWSPIKSTDDIRLRRTGQQTRNSN